MQNKKPSVEGVWIFSGTAQSWVDCTSLVWDCEDILPRNANKNVSKNAKARFLQHQLSRISPSRFTTYLIVDNG